EVRHWLLRRHLGGLFVELVDALDSDAGAEDVAPLLHIGQQRPEPFFVPSGRIDMDGARLPGQAPGNGQDARVDLEALAGRGGGHAPRSSVCTACSASISS